MTTHTRRDGTKLPHVRTDRHSIRANRLYLCARYVVVRTDSSGRVDGMIELGAYFMLVLKLMHTLKLHFCTLLADSLGVGTMWRLYIFALEVERGARIRVSIAEVGRNKGTVKERSDEEGR